MKISYIVNTSILLQIIYFTYNSHCLNNNAFRISGNIMLTIETLLIIIFIDKFVVYSSLCNYAYDVASEHGKF